MTVGPYHILTPTRLFEIHLKERKSIARRIRANHLIDQSFRNKVKMQKYSINKKKFEFLSLFVRQFRWSMIRSMASLDYPQWHRQTISENQPWIFTPPVQQSSRGRTSRLQRSTDLWFVRLVISLIRYSLAYFPSKFSWRIDYTVKCFSNSAAQFHYHQWNEKWLKCIIKSIQMHSKFLNKFLIAFS